MSHNKFTLIVFSVLTFQVGHENYCWSLNLKQIYWGLFSYHICLPLILSKLYSVHKIQHGWVLHLRRPNWCPTLLIESENFSIAFFQELNINIQTNVLWPSRMKKILITVESSMCMSRRLSFSSSSSPWFEKISLLHPCYLLWSSCQSLRYSKHATIGYLEVYIQNNHKIVQSITCPMLRHVAELKLSLLLL